MSEILSISLVIISVLLILIILVQNKNVSLNLSNMGGWMGPVTKRWPEKVLNNITIVLATLFIINSLAFFLI